ncbi:MAG: ferrous iron transporter B [Fibrobacteria bacterium]|nr:ferrous iron transporter B [Fibrobacteria bacterium]
MDSQNGKICLLGNVKVGKTTIFRALADKKQLETTIPGSHVTYNEGTLKGEKTVLIDPPGLNSVFVQSEDGRFSRNYILTEKVEAIVHVLDASNMVRSLALALQFAEFGIPLVLNLNMDDLAQAKGITIDAEKLAVLFGAKVVRTIARERQGISELREAIAYSAVPKRLVKLPEDIEKTLGAITERLKREGVGLPVRGLALLFINEDKSAIGIIQETFGQEVLNECFSMLKTLKENRKRRPSVVLSEAFVYYAQNLAAEFVHQEERKKRPLVTAIGRAAMQLPLGIPIAGLIAYAMYIFVGKIGAEFLVGILEGKLFGEFLIPLVEGWLAPLNNQLVTDFFCGNFGVVSVGLGLAFGVLLPVLFTFYLFFGILEDSGYLPRLSVLLDKAFRIMGMNGKGVLPLIMGLSCITMAIMTVRMLDVKKEKFIVTMLLVLGIPCAPLLSVMFVIFAKLHWSAMAVVFGVIILKLIIAGIVADKLIPGKRGEFILEVHPLRLPSFLLILKRAWSRLYTFMKEAVPIFLVAAVILFVFDKLGGLNALRAALAPTSRILLGLPEQSVEVIVMTLVRREAGAAMLDQLFMKGVFNGLQAVVLLLVMTSLSPCVNAVIVLFKEQGFKYAMWIMGIVIPAAILVGAAVNYGCLFLGITF